MRLRARVLALVALALLVTPGLAMAGEPSTVRLTGTLHAIASDGQWGQELEVGYSLTTDTGDVALAVTGDARGKAGAKVELTGTQLSDGRVAVPAAAIRVLDPAPAAAAGGSGGGSDGGARPATATTTRTVAVVIGYYNDLAGNPVTAAQAADAFYGNPASVKNYFEATSRGRQTTSTTVYGPWALNISQCTGGAGNIWYYSINAMKAAAAAHGVNLAAFDNVVLWTKVPCGISSWIGQAELPGKYSQILVDYAVYSWDEPALATIVAAHEMEHNMSLWHSQGLGCFDASNNEVVLRSDGNCTYFGYADQYTTQGASGASDHALLDAERIRSLGWLDQSEWTDVTSPGTYTIVPVYSGLSGLRELRIAAPNPVSTGHSGSWTIELRSVLGGPFDQFVAGASYAATGVTIRFSEDVGNGFGQSFLVDTAPNGGWLEISGFDKICHCSYWDAPLQPGQTFTDTRRGITVTLNSVTASGASVTISDSSAPTAPASLTATPLAGGGARLDWPAGSDNLGVAHYRLYRDGAQVGEVDGSTLTFTDPPAPGVSGTHTYGVKAVDGAGALSPETTTTATLLGPPDQAPTNVTATPGNSAALVSWTAPPSNGGATITGYAARSTPGGAFTCSTTGALSCVVEGLTNGSSYQFAVAATNPIGTGPESAASAPVSPLPVPGRPTGVVASADVASLHVSWTAPDLGSGDFIGYVATAWPGGLACPQTTSTSCTIGGLTNGQAYTVTVVASSSLGDGLPSDPSAPATPRTVPDAPTGVTAVASDGAAVISWAPPAFSGGAVITSYTVTSDPEGKTCTTSSLSCSIGGLTNHTPYTFTVKARNVAGEGPASDPSPAAVPLVGATYVPLVNPNRLVDSRPSGQTGLTAKLRANTPVSFVVTERFSGDVTRNVPAGSVAVTGNLTVTGQSAKGYLVLTPTAPVGVPGTSTLNFPYGDVRANGVTVPLGPGGTLWVTYVASGGNTTDVVFDVTGYFAPNTSGATYIPLVNPNRLVDSRPSGQTGLTAKLRANTPVSFVVTERFSGDVTRNVPAGSVAVTGNLTVTGQSAKGYLVLTPTAPVGVPGTSTLNFPYGDVRANGVTVLLGPGGTLWVTYVASGGNTTDVVFDVTGYFKT